MEMASRYPSAASLGQRVRARRKQLNLTQTALATQANINQGFLSEIERNLRQPSSKTLAALSIALDVSEAVLVGEGSDHDAPQPREMRDLPLYGTIPAGPPDRSQEQIKMFPVSRHMWGEDRYCLKLNYDSMEPTLKPGDIVLVHYRPDVDPAHVQGRVCACLVDGQSTLKRVTVEVRNGKRIILLRGDNPQVSPLQIDATHDFSIQGVVIRLVSRDLGEQIKNGEFGEDLLNRRPAHCRIPTPQLRERPEDVPRLVHQCLQIANEENDAHIEGVSPEAMRRLTEYGWPGNVRELRGVIESMVIEAETSVLQISDLPEPIQGTREIVPVSGPHLAGWSMAAVERWHVLNTLRLAGGNREKAAKILKIRARTLYRKLKEYGSTN